MNYDTSQQYPMNFQGQNYRENMQSNNIPYNQVMDTVSMMKLLREFMEYKYNQNNVNARHFGRRNMRYKRQVSEDTNTLPAFSELGDRLADKLKETKEKARAKIGNFTCVMKELNVLNDKNQIDLRLMKQDLENYNIPPEWFKNQEIRSLEICHEMSEGVPQTVQDDYDYPGVLPNLAKVKVFMECSEKTRRRTCMRHDMKVKIENNFGPLEQILEQTGLTEAELFPLMQELLSPVKRWSTCKTLWRENRGLMGWLAPGQRVRCWYSGSVDQEQHHPLTHGTLKASIAGYQQLVPMTPQFFHKDCI